MYIFSLFKFQLQLFEYLRPWKKETEELRSRVKHQNDDLHKLRQDFGRIKDVHFFRLFSTSVKSDVAKLLIFSVGHLRKTKSLSWDLATIRIA